MAATAPTSPPTDSRLTTLAESALARSGGYVLTRLLSAEFAEQLRAEAYEVHAQAQEARLAAAQRDDSMRGAPDRWLESATGGAACQTLFWAPEVTAYLRQMTGIDWMPLGEQGSYSYYRRPGHYLGLHRDIESCDLAIITCVENTGEGTGGVLTAYPGRCREDLVSIRATPGMGARSIHLQVGESVVLLGGIVAHCVTPINGTQLRVVAPLCYRAGPGESSAGDHLSS